MRRKLKTLIKRKRDGFLRASVEPAAAIFFGLWVALSVPIEFLEEVLIAFIVAHLPLDENSKRAIFLRVRSIHLTKMLAKQVNNLSRLRWPINKKPFSSSR